MSTMTHIFENNTKKKKNKNKGLLMDSRDKLSYNYNKINSSEYSRLPLSRNQRDSMKHFEISVLRHIRFVELRKTINRTTTFNRMNM